MAAEKLTTSNRVAYGILALEVVAILVLAYMRFILHRLPLIPGVNTAPNPILGQQ